MSDSEYKATRRAALRAAGLCYECGRERDGASLRCQQCRTENMIRTERSQFKAREREAVS